MLLDPNLGDTQGCSEIPATARHHSHGFMLHMKLLQFAVLGIVKALWDGGVRIWESFLEVSAPSRLMSQGSLFEVQSCHVSLEFP